MNQSFVRAKKERAESQEKQVNELLEQDKKPSRAATKPRVKTAEPTARKRNYKEPVADTQRRTEKSFSRPPKKDDPAGDRKKIYKASGAERTPSSGKSFKPRSDSRSSGEKRSYKPSPVKRSTDRRK